MLSLCVPVPIRVRSFKENNIKKESVFVNQSNFKKNFNMKMRSIAFLERKKRK